MSRLTEPLEEIKKKMTSMKSEAPIRVIGKERIVNKGRPIWPMNIW